MVDGRQLPAQHLMPDFSKGLYAECYQGLLRASGQYLNDWSNNLAKTLKDTITIMAFGQFDNIVTIDKHIAVMFDYTT